MEFIRRQTDEKVTVGFVLKLKVCIASRLLSLRLYVYMQWFIVRRAVDEECDSAPPLHPGIRIRMKQVNHSTRM